MLVAGMPLTTEVRNEVIEHHYGQAQAIGRNFAYRWDREIDEYISVAGHGLVMTVHKLDHKSCPNPENDGLSKLISKSVRNSCYRYLKYEFVRENHRAELDEDIQIALNDIHDFLNDFVTTLAGTHQLTDKQKLALYSIGRGETVNQAAHIGGMKHNMELVRLLTKIREGARSYVL
jgi:hypothetical protein